MTITADAVKELRERTGMGLIEARDYLRRQELIADLDPERPNSMVAALRFLLATDHLGLRPNPN